MQFFPIADSEIVKALQQLLKSRIQHQPEEDGSFHLSAPFLMINTAGNRFSPLQPDSYLYL